MSYYFSKTMSGTSFEEAIIKVTSELKREEFGVLTEIDIKKTLKNKLDVDFKRYTILGACNPNAAHQILRKEDKVGVFMPCNVIVEENENGEIEVSAVDPIAALKAVDNNSIGCHLIEMQHRLKRVIENM